MKTKLLAILLAAVMVVTLLPITAFATEELTEIDEINIVLNNRGLAGKTWGEVKDSIVSIPNNPDNLTIDNLQLADFNDGEDGNPILWGDSDEITPGKYYLSVVFKAPEGSYFKHKPGSGLENITYSRIEDDGLQLNVSGNKKINSVSISPVFGYEPIGEYFITIEDRICGDGNLDTEYSAEETRIAKYNERKYDVIYNSIIIVFDVRENDLSSDQSEIKGVITEADFAYEMVIPSDTVLTEDDHKDVLLGGDGIVTIDVTKHALNGIDVYYTVDLTNGKLTDGTHDIATTYGFSEDGTNFVDVTAETEYTVYTGGAEVNTYINVTADGDDWDDAPVGDYNATVVFNFGQKPTSYGVTIDDVFPKDLRASTEYDMLIFGYTFNGMSATVVKPNSALATAFAEDLEEDCGNHFVIASYGVVLPLSTDLTPIDGGYQCITPYPTVTGLDIEINFIMESDTLSEIDVTMVMDKQRTPAGEFTYSAPETTTVAEIASGVSEWTYEDNPEYKFTYENDSLNLYHNDVVVKTLPGTSTLYSFGEDTWVYLGEETMYSFTMFEGALGSIVAYEGESEIYGLAPEEP